MIRYHAFSKRYGGRTVVDRLTFTVPRGSVVALLGPNGSGKTTSIKAAAGLIRPDAGEVTLGEPALSAWDPRARRTCSYLPQRVSFPEALSGREVVEFYRRLRQTPIDATERALKLASLNGSASRAVATYSGGMVQRLGLAVATLAQTDTLLLDEPTAALDPEGLDAFYTTLADRRRAGASIFFSSHQLGDVERLADRIAVIVDGVLVADLTAAELAQRLADRGEMRLTMAGRVAGLMPRILEQAPQATWVGAELHVPGPAAARPAVLDLIQRAGGEITGISTEAGRLDALYRDLVGGAP